MNLDVRDRDYWLKKAQIKLLREKIEKIRMARMAWAEGADVKEEIDGYKSALETLEGPVKRKWFKTWTGAIGRRKG